MLRKNFFGVKQIKEVLMLNKPFYVGACILNLRKTHVRFSLLSIDNSAYDKNSEFYFDYNEKVIGKMKDETVRVLIKEFIRLR